MMLVLEVLFARAILYHLPYTRALYYVSIRYVAVALSITQALVIAFFET